MKQLIVPIALSLVCGSVAAQSVPPGHPALPGGKAAKPVADAPLPQKGKVVSTLDAAPYVYIEVAQGKKNVWLAANAVPVKKGDVIRFDDGMQMTNFHSKTLNRTFPSVLFVNRVAVTKEKE